MTRRPRPHRDDYATVDEYLAEFHLVRVLDRDDRLNPAELAARWRAILDLLEHRDPAWRVAVRSFRQDHPDLLGDAR